MAPNIPNGFAIVGSFEQIFDLLFGKGQHDAHVIEWRRNSFLKSRTGNFDQRMAEMKAEGRRLAALSMGQTTQFLEAAE